MAKRFITLPTVPRGESAGEIHVSCPACRERTPLKQLRVQTMVCPWCDFHYPWEAEARLDQLADADSFQPLAEAPAGPSRFGWATLDGRPLALAVADPATTWTTAEAQALILLVEQARQERHPLLWAVTAPQGVADEAPWPGVQAALSRLGESGLPCFSLLAGPCYGPAGALALQADLVLAEPGAAISLIPPEALRQAGRLPPDSLRPPRQLLQDGWADAVLPRLKQRRSLTLLFDFLGPEGKGPRRSPAAIGEEWAVPSRIPAKAADLLEFFFELHGDRRTGDDPSIVGGLACLRKHALPLLILATAQNPSWPGGPRRGATIGVGGWRKATRLLHLAGRFALPVLIVIEAAETACRRRDRPAELAAAWGETLSTLLALPVPTTALLLGRSDGWVGQALAATDCILAIEPVEEPLKALPLDGTFAETEDLLNTLIQRFQELIQNYAGRGPLGRQKLRQRRYVRWTRRTGRGDEIRS